MTTKLSTTVIASLLLSAACAVYAQVPAGVPFDPGKHPNPIVTWVSEKDFRKVPFVEAAEIVGVELMSLSRDEGERTSVEIATPSTGRQRVRIVNSEYEVTFYPVMRQTYNLKSSSTFTLYTFRFPRALDNRRLPQSGRLRTTSARDRTPIRIASRSGQDRHPGSAWTVF